MCQFKSLYYVDEKAHVLYCDKCDHLKVFFGTLALTLHREEFEDFQEHIESLVASEPTIKPGFQAIHTDIELSQTGISMSLNRTELQQLAQILDIAETRLLTQEMISLFDNE